MVFLLIGCSVVNSNQMKSAPYLKSVNNTCSSWSGYRILEKGDTDLGNGIYGILRARVVMSSKLFLPLFQVHLAARVILRDLLPPERKPKSQFGHNLLLHERNHSIKDWFACKYCSPLFFSIGIDWWTSQARRNQRSFRKYPCQYS